MCWVSRHAIGFGFHYFRKAEVQDITAMKQLDNLMYAGCSCEELSVPHKRWPVSYIGKSVGLCASVEESMRTTVRFPMAADFQRFKSRASMVLCTGTLKGEHVHQSRPLG